MTDPRHDEDTLFLSRVVNAASIRGLMDDPRWEYIVAVISDSMRAAQTRATIARRDPSLDGMIKVGHYEARISALKDLLHTFTRLYDGAGKVLIEAQTKLPYAPGPPEKT